MAHIGKSDRRMIFTLVPVALLACTSLAAAQTNTVPFNESPEAEAEQMPGADAKPMKPLIPEEDGVGVVDDGTEPADPAARGMDDSDLAVGEKKPADGSEAQAAQQDGAATDETSSGEGAMTAEKPESEDATGMNKTAEGEQSGEDTKQLNQAAKEGGSDGETPQDKQTEAQNNEPGSASDEELATAGSEKGDETGDNKQAAEGDAPDCATMVKDSKGSREELRKKVAEAAVTHPLILAMADGSFVYVGEEGGLSEPLESWFANEETAKDQKATAEQATQDVAARDDAACAEDLQKTMDSGSEQTDAQKPAAN